MESFYKDNWSWRIAGGSEEDSIVISFVTVDPITASFVAIIQRLKLPVAIRYFV